jgi:hypothetical protein
LPVKAYRYQVFDGATTGSVLMGLADPTDPYITEVWIPASRQKRIAGSANTHISDPVGGISTSNLGGVTWGDGEVILEQGSIDYIIGLPEMLPEGLDPGDLVRRWVGFVPGEERSLRTARIFLQDRDGEVHMAKPSTIAMLIPDPEMSVKPWTNERLFVPPEADPPVSGPDARYDRPLVLLDEEEYMDYFRSVVPGLDEGRVVQVDLEWKGDRISKLIIFNNDPVTTGLAEWELLRTGVPHKYITKRTLEADPDRNLSEDEDAA